MKKITLIASLAVLLISCREAPDAQEASESALITKINAVQEQIMAQGNISPEEEQALSSLCAIVSTNDGLANHSPDQRMILKDADIAPVFEGCEDLSAAETRTCFNDKVATFIVNEFDSSIASDLNLKEPMQVEAFFIINENGEVSGLKVRDSEISIQAEILRVLRDIPKMQPAMHNGASVSVLCSIVVTYGNSIAVDVVYIPERPDEIE